MGYLQHRGLPVGVLLEDRARFRDLSPRDELDRLRQFNRLLQEFCSLWPGLIRFGGFFLCYFQGLYQVQVPFGLFLGDYRRKEGGLAV